MGNLLFAGLSDKEAKRLKEKWKLASGQVFNALYLDEFFKEVVLSGKVKIDSGGRTLEFKLRPDPQSLTVDVLLQLN